MTSELVARPIWPTTLFFRHWDDHRLHAPGILAHLHALQSAERESIASGVAPGAKPATGLFESRFNLFATEHPGLRKLIAFIGDSLSRAVAQVNGATDPERIKVSATESWFHITQDGGFHDAHFHHNCSWCGIYYVEAGDCGAVTGQTGAGNGVNRFYMPLGSGGAYWDYGNEYLRKTSVFDVTPEAGLLILFPSYLLHSALLYRGQQDRVVISFNAQAVRG